MRSLLTVLVFLVLNAQLSIANGQQQVSLSRLDAFRPSKPDPTCVCDPLCDHIPSDCRSVVARQDCDCCQVCAVTDAGDSCDPVTKPCDVTKKLECDPVEKVCKGRHRCDDDRLYSVNFTLANDDNGNYFFALLHTLMQERQLIIPLNQKSENRCKAVQLTVNV